MTDIESSPALVVLYQWRYRSQYWDDIEKRPAGRVHVSGWFVYAASVSNAARYSVTALAVRSQGSDLLNSIKLPPVIRAWPRLWWLIRNELNVGWKRVCQWPVGFFANETAAGSISAALLNSCVVSAFQCSKRHKEKKTCRHWKEAT